MAGRTETTLAGFAADSKALWLRLREYYDQTRGLRWCIAILLFLLYGVRLAQGDLFIDSEIMLTDHESMLFSWYGHKRPGLVWAKELFGLGRLTPFLANGLLVLTLGLLTFGLCFCLDYWNGKRRPDTGRSILFVVFFLSAPCLAEQFNFLLQAFEIAFAMVLCLFAVFAAGLWVYERKSWLWAFAAFVGMVWSFGFYQAFPAVYIALVVISYLGMYLRGDDGCGFREGVLHVALFVAGFVFSQVIASLISRQVGASSAYVNSMFLWLSQSVETCIANIRLEIWWMYQGHRPEFYNVIFTPVAVAASLVWLWLGWKKLRRTGKKRLPFLCFAFAVVFLPVTPMLITLLTGMNQPIRGQLVFPVVMAYLVWALYDGVGEWLGDVRTKNCPCEEAVGDFCEAGVIPGKRGVSVVMVLLLITGLRIGWSQCVTMCQLWETAHEGYVQDVLTANRMYPDICRAAGEEPVEACQVVFAGKRGLSLAGDALLGDAIGYSFFEWDSAGAIGVSSRAHALFQVLGMKMMKPEAEQYQEALAACEGVPVWPEDGSVFKVRDGLILVKLSEVL